MLRLFKEGNTAKLIVTMTTSQFTSGEKYTASSIFATFYTLNGTNDGLEKSTTIGASGTITLSTNTDGKTGFHSAVVDFSAETAKSYVVVYEATIDGVNAIGQEFLDVSAELKVIEDLGTRLTQIRADGMPPATMSRV